MCVFVSGVYPIAILSEVFCVICCLLMFVSDASGEHMCLVMALYVARIVSPHVVGGSALSICIVLRAFVVVMSVFVVCAFGV